MQLFLTLPYPHPIWCGPSRTFSLGISHHHLPLGASGVLVSCSEAPILVFRMLPQKEKVTMMTSEWMGFLPPFTAQEAVGFSEKRRGAMPPAPVWEQTVLGCLRGTQPLPGPAPSSVLRTGRPLPLLEAHRASGPGCGSTLTAPRDSRDSRGLRPPRCL